jgi:hypothetical protein
MTDLEYISQLLSHLYAGPQYRRTYRQEIDFYSQIRYQNRRKHLTGQPVDSAETISEMVGYISKKNESILQSQWNRMSAIAGMSIKRSVS